MNQLQQTLTQNGFHLDPKVQSQLNYFLELVQEWNKGINLTAHSDLETLIEKDILDACYSLKGIRHFKPNLTSLIDLGAGGGLIGVPLLCLDPNLSVLMLDSNKKRINFIRTALRELKLTNGKTHLGDVKAAYSELPAFESTLTRATWGLDEYLPFAKPYLKDKGILFFMGGPNQTIPKNLDPALTSQTPYSYQILPKQYQRTLFSFEHI